MSWHRTLRDPTAAGPHSPLFVHYYGNKDSNPMSWIASRQCRRLLSPLFGMKALLRFGAKENGKLQLTSPLRVVSACLRAGTSHNGIQLHPTEDKACSNPYAVLASPANIADGHRPSCLDVPMAAPRGAEVEHGVTAVPCGHRSAPRLCNWAQWGPTARHAG